MQNKIMKFDPATRQSNPYPSHAAQWRDYHGQMTAWLFNPWTGELRNPEMAGDTYIDDGLHYEMSAVHKVICTTPMPQHVETGEWWWIGNIPTGVLVDDFYLTHNTGVKQ